MKLIAFCSVLQIPILLLASPEADDVCAELGGCNEKIVLMQKSTKMAVQINSDGSGDPPPSPTPASASAVELSLFKQLHCVAEDDDAKCQCKELMVSAICSERREKERWSLLLPGLDTNNDGSIDTEEWQQMGSSNLNQAEPFDAPEGHHSIGMLQLEKEEPILIADLVLLFAKAMGDAFEGLLEHQSCSEVLEAKHLYWDEAFFGSPLALTEFDGMCIKIFNPPKKQATELDVFEEEKPFVAEAAVGSGGLTLLETEMSQLTGMDAAMSILSTKDVQMIRHDIDISSIKHDSDINEFVNFSMFKKISRLQKAASREVAFAGMLKVVTSTLGAEFCHKEIWTKGTTFLRCASGWYQGTDYVNSGLCYKHCNSGYTRFGDHCWQNCPSGYTNLGAVCERSWCDGTCWWAGNWRVDVWSKGTYYSAGRSLGDSSCNMCPSGYEQTGLACYEKCKSGYSCPRHGLTGLVNCRHPMPTTCLAGCAVDPSTCGKAMAEMIQGAIDAMVSSAVLVMSFGTSSVAAVGASSLKAMARSTAKNSRRIAIRVGKQEFKDQVNIERKKVIKEAIKDNMKGKVDEAGQKLMVDYTLSESESLRDWYVQKFKDEESEADRLSKLVQSVDPTGLSKAIDGSTGEVEGAHVQAANWLSVVSFVDPTGISGAVAEIIKHGYCQPKWSDMEKEVMEQIVSLSAKKLPSLPAPDPWEAWQFEMPSHFGFR